MRSFWLVPALALSAAAYAETVVPDKQQRLISETCTLISQQRNSQSDAAAVAEAQRRIAQERVEQWETYFRAYTGEAKS